jgi:uncharacterized protein (TIGR02996 family)
MHEEEAFFQAIQEHPEDTALRLVFADWLEERGDPRAELLRLLHLLTQAGEVRERPELEDRLRGLLASGVQAVGPYITNSIGMKLVLIPAGTFHMGSPETDKLAWPEEMPRHEVTIARPFCLGVHTVTRRQYQRFVEDMTRQAAAETDDEGGAARDREDQESFDRNSWRKPGFAQTDAHPVVNVSAHDAEVFCKWLSMKEGQKYRLPTEAEWEYSCRAGTETRFHSGDDADSLARVANFDDAYPNTAPVGQFQPNGFGLYDMHGNVWEWCQDWYHPDDYRNSPKKDPQGPSRNVYRVLRGGSFIRGPAGCRSAYRFGAAYSSRACFIGFRVALVR